MMKDKLSEICCGVGCFVLQKNSTIVWFAVIKYKVSLLLTIEMSGVYKFKQIIGIFLKGLCSSDHLYLIILPLF